MGTSKELIMSKINFERILVWWKLVVIQLIGVGIIFIIPKIGIYQLLKKVVGSHSDISGYILLIFIILPGLIAWKKKIRLWWIPTLLMLIPFIVSLIGYIILILKKNNII